jgi:hypothetical protein
MRAALEGLSQGSLFDAKQTAQTVGADESFVWFPTLGLGVLQVTAPPEQVYNEDYFRKYQGYAETDQGKRITAMREGLVRQYVPESDEVLDFGAGACLFVRTRPNTFGFDVNPFTIEDLHARGKFRSPYTGPVKHLTCWDSLEHEPDPCRLLKQVTGFVFISIPIFRDVDHARHSKHFRPDEHWWYFSARGLIEWMDRQGFIVREFTDMESRYCGREDIGTFVFQRRG